MSTTNRQPGTNVTTQPGRAYRPRKRERLPTVDATPLQPRDNSAEVWAGFDADVFAFCDGRRSVEEIAREFHGHPGLQISGSEDSTAAKTIVSKALCRLFRRGLLETIEEAVLRGVLAFHGPRIHDYRIRDICTGDYFTAVCLNDGSQGVAINFNNVSGPHRASFSHRHYDYLLSRLIESDGILCDTFLGQPVLDSLGQSVRLAILNALSGQMLAPERLRSEHGLDIQDGYLDLATFFRPGDTVAMIGCTGNYSCQRVGKLTEIGTVYFSDFEYVEPFKAGIVECIRENFVRPEKVLLSAGEDNEAICRKADVVVMIADTLCTNTLDELLLWSLGAREVLITGRSYMMDPIHLFDRGVSGITTQRILHPDYIGVVRDKIDRGEFGFTDTLVGCFERRYVVRQ